MEQAIALKQYGHEVTILFCDTFSLKYARNYYEYDEHRVENISGVTIIRKKKFCPLKHGNGIYGCRHAFYMGIMELYNENIGDKIDIIHAHCCLWGGYAASILSKKTGIPYVVTEHSSFFGLHRNNITKSTEIIVKKVYSQSKQTICVSDKLKKDIYKYCDNSLVLGNVIDCNLFKIGDKHQDDFFLFFTCFHMTSKSQIYEKGFATLIDALEILLKSKVNVKLYVGGGGDALEISKEIVKEKKMCEVVTFLGDISRCEVAKNMQKCDAFVLPSNYETFGIVYAEAMACGKPVIATHNGGINSYIDSSNGILVSPNDPKNLECAMQYIISNIDEYDEKLIREKVKDTFSTEAIASKLTRIYKECI